MTSPMKVRKLQKFHKFDLVWVHVVSPYMEHFDTDFFGIVAYSYFEKHGGDEQQAKQYSIISLNDKLTKVTNQIAWYFEADLTISNKLSRKQIENILEDLTWIDI